MEVVMQDTPELMASKQLVTAQLLTVTDRVLSEGDSILFTASTPESIILKTRVP